MEPLNQDNQPKQKINLAAGPAREGAGRIIRFFVFLTLIILVAINWQTVTQIFNYKTIYTDIIDSFKNGLGNVATDVNHIKVPEIKLGEENYIAKTVDKEDSIEIAKIGIAAPLVFINSTENSDYDVALKNGVAHYFTSVMPNEKGQTIFLGHSAPAGWPKIHYDWVFSDINSLIAGDEIVINYNNGEYRYKVTEKYILKQGDDVPNSDLTNSRYMVVLISCWPPGVNYKRIAVEAELIK